MALSLFKRKFSLHLIIQETFLAFGKLNWWSTS